jgi:hypothetical protein
MWKTIRFYPNYEISTNGDIRNKTTLRVLKSRVNKHGFAMCLLKNFVGVNHWLEIRETMDLHFTIEEIMNC